MNRSCFILVTVLTLIAPAAHAKSYTVSVTSYNPVVGQTDDSPCVGAASIDVCQRTKNGGRVIALSQDLVGHSAKKPFHYRDVVKLASANPACQGEFVVLDTMNKRLKLMGDLFYLDRKDNTSCVATVQKVK